MRDSAQSLGVNAPTEITERFVFRAKNAVEDATKALAEQGLDPNFAERLQVARDSTHFFLERGHARQVWEEFNRLVDLLWENNRRKAAAA